MLSCLFVLVFYGFVCPSEVQVVFFNRAYCIVPYEFKHEAVFLHIFCPLVNVILSLFGTCLAI